MALRETVRSLKAFFVLGALCIAAFDLYGLAYGHIGTAAAAISAVLGWSFLYVGVRLRQLLVTAVGEVKALLIAAAVFWVLYFAADRLAGVGGWPEFIVGSVIYLAVTWYLLVNVRRLAAESQPHTGTPGPHRDGSTALHCPTCRVRLESDHVGETVFQACHKCRGVLMPLTAVHRTIRQGIRDQLLARIRATRTEGQRSCPLCGHAMTLVTVPRGPRAVGLDICYPCASVWFDANKSDVLRAMYGIEEPPRRMLDHEWKWAVALLGMPVTRQRPPRLNRPWLTWSLAAIIAMLSATAWSSPVLQSWLILVPSLMDRMGGVTLLTYFFLHGGLVHLLSNLYFLIVFGAQVEDYLGRRRYLFLLLFATLAGSLSHVALNPGSNIPVVGASGGIAGIVVFYGLQFPRVRLLILTAWLLFFPLRLRAGIFLLLWFLLQVLGAWQQIHGFSNTSFLAHLGGAAVGLLFWGVWRTRLGAAPRLPAPVTPT